jgi:hypothetical protein
MNFQLEENQPHGPRYHRLHVARRPCMFFRFSLHFTFSEVSFQVFSLVSESACEHSIQTVQLHCAILGCNLTTFSVIHGSTACSLPGNTFVWARARIPLSTRLPLVHACITARSILPPCTLRAFSFYRKFVSTTNWVLLCRENHGERKCSWLTCCADI